MRPHFLPSCFIGLTRSSNPTSFSAAITIVGMFTSTPLAHVFISLTCLPSCENNLHLIQHQHSLISTINLDLIEGFCDNDDLIEASKIWNLMVDEGVDLWSNF